MKIPKSLASFQKESSDRVFWHNIEKNLYDEEVQVMYTFRLIGMPVFKYAKSIHTIHNFDNEKTFGKINGFQSNHPKK